MRLHYCCSQANLHVIIRHVVLFYSLQFAVPAVAWYFRAMFLHLASRKVCEQVYVDYRRTHQASDSTTRLLRKVSEKLRSVVLGVAAIIINSYT